MGDSRGLIAPFALSRQIGPRPEGHTPTHTSAAGHTSAASHTSNHMSQRREIAPLEANADHASLCYGLCTPVRSSPIR
jgi:hypothetical protein